MNKAAVVLLSGLLLSACATTQMNKPLTPQSLRSDGEFISTGGYRFSALHDGRSAQELLVLLSFSGGGKRSAAFGYGVLKGLRNFVIRIKGQERRLLDEIDMVSAVSGGSFPAAYYGLYRDKIFTNFEHDFLRRDIDSYVWGSYLLPWTIGVPTNERMAKVYDDLMFHGATYADLQRVGRPLVSINATDVVYKLVFPFTQDYFDLICSDLSSMPIAQGVAASNGFPILFTPITLKSYGEKCGGRVPAWVRREADGPALTRSRQFAQGARQYLDPQATRYVHLMDGGISDNLAMRSMINAILILTSDDTVLHEANFTPVRRILLINADGQAHSTADDAKRAELSRIDQVFDAVTGTQIDRYDFETLLLAKEQIEELQESIKRVRCQFGPTIDGHACNDVQSTFIHLSLADVSDAAERDYLERIPVRLTLKDTDIDRLVAAGETLVALSPELKNFRTSLADSVAEVRNDLSAPH
jgi:NTE family protein